MSYPRGYHKPTRPPEPSPPPPPFRARHAAHPRPRRRIAPRTPLIPPSAFRDTPPGRAPVAPCVPPAPSDGVSCTTRRPIRSPVVWTDGTHAALVLAVVAGAVKSGDASCRGAGHAVASPSAGAAFRGATRAPPIARAPSGCGWLRPSWGAGRGRRFALSRAGPDMAILESPSGYRRLGCGGSGTLPNRGGGRRVLAVVAGPAQFPWSRPVTRTPAVAGIAFLSPSASPGLGPDVTRWVRRAVGRRRPVRRWR